MDRPLFSNLNLITMNHFFLIFYTSARLGETWIIESDPLFCASLIDSLNLLLKNLDSKVHFFKEKKRLFYEISFF